MKLILEGIKLSSLFIMLIAIFPPLSIFYSGYKHKKMKNFQNKDMIVINAISIGFIGIFILSGILDWSILIIYLIFLFQEVLFEWFKKFGAHLKVFDRINLMSIIITILLFVVSNYIMNKVGLDFDKIKSIYKSTTEISETELNLVFKYIENNKYLIWFIYSYASAIVFNFIFYRRVMEYWYMGYLWVVFYIMAFFLGFFYKDNLLIENIKTILQIMIGVYGLKFAFIALKKWEVNKIIATIILIGAMLFVPQLFFVLGAIRVLMI